MSPRALRLVRGWVAAWAATTFAVLAHVAAGGQWPHPMLYVMCVALSAPVCMALAGITRHIAGLSAAVVGSQTFFHSVLSFSGGYVAAGNHAGHVKAHAVDSAPSAVLVPHSGSMGHTEHLMSSGHQAVIGGLDTAMVVMHLLVALVAVCVLRYGERGVFALLATLMVRAVQLIVALMMPWVSVRPWHPGFLRPEPARVLTWARGTRTHRGPPMIAVLA
ncbi:MAG: hypothetical protein Q4C81_01405 [Kocuria sp.]|nr:hypothetical protein [Kocuria sp.]